MNRSLHLGAAALFYILLAYTGLLFFTVNYQAVTPGLDASWGFAVNLFAHGPELFGRDLVLTYGPLAYLAVPQHVGANLQIAAAMHIAVWCLLLYQLLELWDSGRKAGAAFFVIGLICSNRLFFDYWDYLLSAILLLALLRLFRKPDSVSALLIYALITGLALLVKFTGFILAMLLLVIFTASVLARQEKTSLRTRLLIALALVSGPLAYLIYNPSPVDLVVYMRSSFSMASGYSTTMSLPPGPALLWKAAALLIVLGAATGLALWKRWITATGAAMVTVTAWIAFKHGYVRGEASHAAMFFCFIILVFAFLLAQMAYTWKRAAIFAVTFGAFIAFALQGASARSFWNVWSSYWWSPSHNLAQVAQLLKWRQATESLDGISEDAFRTSAVNDFAPVLGKSRVLFFPWDVSYGVRGAFHTVPLFATQAYSSYTHYLDAQGASHLAHAVPPIDFVLLEWKSVDWRNPFLDVPATWNALYANFAPVPGIGDALLLKNRGKPLPIAFEETNTQPCLDEQWTAVPPSAEPIALSMKLSPTLWGQAVTTLYQLAQVNLQVETRSGFNTTIRIPPDVVSSPFPLNYLPLNPPGLNALWRDNRVADPVVKFRVTGPGMRHLSCGPLHFYKVQGTPIVIS